MKNFKKIFSIMTFIITIDIICSIILIKIYNTNIRKNLIIYSESEVGKIVNLVINRSVNNYFTNINDVDLLEIEKDNSNNIKYISLKTNKVNEYIKDVTDIVENNIRSIFINGSNNLGIDLDVVSDFNYSYIGNSSVLEVTTGSFSKSFLLSNLGPNIPIRMNIVGDVVSNMETKVKEYGINNAILEVHIKVEVETIINTPFISKTVKTKRSVPIFVNIINGNIPDNYIGSLNKNT